MRIGKSPGHDGLTEEFYEHFWDDLKFYLLISWNSLKLMVNSLFLKGKQL